LQTRMATRLPTETRPSPTWFTASVWALMSVSTQALKLSMVRMCFVMDASQPWGAAKSGRRRAAGGETARGHAGERGGGARDWRLAGTSPGSRRAGRRRAGRRRVGLVRGEAARGKAARDEAARGEAARGVVARG